MCLLTRERKAMYMTRIEYSVMGGRVAEFEAGQAQYGEVLRQQPGFQQLVMLNSLGYPAKYTLLVRWESRDAHRAWSRSDAFQDFAKEHPFRNDELYTRSRPLEAYEVVLEVVNEGQQEAYVSLIDTIIDVRPGNATYFESSRKELF